MSRFLTKEVFILILIGVIVIIIGDTNYLGKWFSIGAVAPINTVLKTIGSVSLGSGVFTAIIKSEKFLEIFKKTVDDVLWSPDFLRQRKDNRKLWGTLSKIMYDEKFPHISEELENIIVSKYFPIDHDYYLEDYKIKINITDVNQEFAKHLETVSFKLWPIDHKKILNYSSKVDIKLPANGHTAYTDFKINFLTVNGQNLPFSVEKVDQDADSIIYEFSFQISNSSQYDIVLVREKILSKAMNKDKRIFAQRFIKNLYVELITTTGLKVDFFKMGTINDFNKNPDNVNGNSTIREWSYEGLILPKQGFTLLLDS